MERFCLVLALLAVPAYAQEKQCLDPVSGAYYLTHGQCAARSNHLYKCPGKDGVPEYRSWPCDGRAAEKSWKIEQHFDPNADRRYVERTRAESERRAQQNRARYSGGSGGGQAWSGAATESRDRRCEAAKRTRDEALGRLGLKRTHEDLRRWGDYVYERCKP